MFVLRTQGVGWTKISVVTGGNYGKECLIHQVAGVRYIIRRKHSDVGYEDIMNRQSLESIGHLSWRQLGNVTEARDREDTRTRADSRYNRDIRRFNECQWIINQKRHRSKATSGRDPWRDTTSSHLKVYVHYSYIPKVNDLTILSL